jgi:molybdopterin/thiamine biosynthesis adenylyltransferase
MNVERHDRQIRIPQLGCEGQQRLAQSRVLVVGAGGLGSPVVLYLAAAGVGMLGIADNDTVVCSNLNRQVLHRTADIGADKVGSAARAVRALDPAIRLELYQERVDARRVAELAAGYDLVVDATDGFGSKYAVNDGAIRAGKPFVHAGVEGLTGQVGLLGLPGDPCLRCIFPTAPPDPSEPRPILGAAAGVLGTLAACEAIKHLARLVADGPSKLLVVNLWTLHFHTIAAERDPDCPCCATRPTSAG